MSAGLYNDNRLKLGIFGTNVSYGCSATTAEGHWEATWPANVEMVTLADQAGLEAFIPVARWRGFGGKTNFNGTCFETYTWAAGLGALTKNIHVFSTSHVPTIHPIVAAKQATTIDHISNGRFGLNIVCGWFESEFRMFGSSVMEHESLYEYAAEWFEIVRKLWTVDGEFDFEGRLFKVEKGFHEPKPIQKPYPPIMNAGSSPRGARFAAKYADMVFTSVGDLDDETAAKIKGLRELGREFNREFQLWTSCSVVCRPTEQEALDYARYYILEKGDWEAVANLAGARPDRPGQHPGPDPKNLKNPGWGGHMLLGTPEQIVDGLIKLAEVGVDGTVLSWVDYPEGMRQWNREVLPLMEQAGLRKPYRPERA